MTLIHRSPCRHPERQSAAREIPMICGPTGSFPQLACTFAVLFSTELCLATPPTHEHINPYAKAHENAKRGAELSQRDELDRKETKVHTSGKHKTPLAPNNKTTPFEEVDNAEHTVPTSFNNAPHPEPLTKPFSVGGIMAQVDDNTWFKFYGFFQTRYITGAHKTTEGKVAGGGFSLARARIFLRGHLTDWLGTLLRVGARSDGSVNIEQAYADFEYRAFSLRVGQWYLPVFQEQFLSPSATLALNPSAVGSVFDGGQTQGARILWNLNETRLQLALSNGLRAGFSEVGSPKIADIAGTFRAERVLGGKSYGRFNTGSSFRGKGWSTLLGVGGHYQSGGELHFNAVELGSFNSDVTVEGPGINIHISSSAIVTDGADDSRLLIAGLVGQGGFFVSNKTELYGRYEVLLSDSPNDGSATDLSFFRGLTGGVNYYFWPARGMRLQGDFIYYFDPSIDTPLAMNPNAGLFASTSAQWTFRTQLNVLF